MAVLSCSQVSQKKLDYSMSCHALSNKDNKGTTKQKVYTIPLENITTTMMKTQGRNSVVNSYKENMTMCKQEMITGCEGL